MRGYPTGMLRAAIEFLQSQQERDGTWREFVTLAGEGVDWPTGFVAMQLAEAGADAAVLDRAADALASTQRDDGGWGYHSCVPTDADSTAWVMLFLASRAGRNDHVERAAACLARHQDSDTGGLPTYFEPGPIRSYMGLGRHVSVDGWCSPHVEVTATAGRAFAAVDERARAAAAWGFVRSRQRDDGSWHSYWWASPFYPTLQAVELACVLGEQDGIGRAVTWLLEAQRDDGGWGAPVSAFATALALSVLVRAGERGSAAERAIERLASLQDSDGGWPGHACFRIPPPGMVEPEHFTKWRVGKPGTGVVVRDRNRLFTTAACVGALARSGAA